VTLKTVAIIGGGFCGTVAAANLARLAKVPLRVVVIHSGSPFGRGVAYGTKQPEHLLNVAARNMSAFPDRPNHFVDWLGTRSEYADVPEPVLREQFIPRKTYGDYLQALLFWHTRGAGNTNVQLDIVHGEAFDVVVGPERAAVVVEGHPTIEADKVLLATGNPPPAELPFAAGFQHPRFLQNPWKLPDFSQTDPRENIVLVGAGLTMIDVFLTLSSCRWQGTIFAVSRTGLLPLSHFHGVAHPEFPPADPTHLGLSALVNLMEEHCARLRNQGENPAIVVDKLRPFTQRIWQHFSIAERERFLREYRTRWNVVRHRVAQSIHEQVTTAISAKALQVLQGRIGELSSGSAGVKLTVTTKAGEHIPLEAGWVINCTGPLESYRNSPSALYQNLFDRGLVQADALDMGIKADADFVVTDGGGHCSEFLFAIGPMLKGSLWETTAVPELRIQALRVAEKMLAALQGGAAPGWFAEMWVDVIEYVI
jgi:uncharacterized NAD(P)/FAD-binding protein YdhS